MKIRRVVTGKNAEGKSVFISDGSSPREMALQHTPGFVSSPQWTIDATPDLTRVGGADPMASEGTMLASVGGSVFWMITFPPDSVMMSGDWKPELAGPEHLKAAPGIAERFEMDNPGMHQTPTVDYVTIVKGRVVLELDDGKSVELKQGDTVVQQGARHAWRNPFSEPVTISVVMLGARTQ
ncbi:MAG: cupin domain-containing protein [Mesorhizobium sp.]|nr:cupin domain-containing protein [bacterium M00.F.Ca.ET.205.01.1.1]TGU46654.1 cupin domain-containing protein [bacterium M00.F.Ca.ET.152.01.1.1]TGV31769.1 cupin domain-containing protein [Mesorhizobium sp. M00.F.Ca.ET.186.01.1.1]TGZ38924.1 cupin domain-containing protein [bacterium M00.F.Ca.ET.162.01.1.1]TJW32332.1 MAG: cupin domain-containing protein [Mesorhizobium sp.]